MKEEKEMKNSVNKVLLEGNVGNIGNVYENTNGKKSFKFDLGQNNNGNSQFVSITVKGNLVESYGNKIEKGDWITIKGRINSYSKEVEGKKYKEKMTEILAFEIEDHNKNLVYKADGSIVEKVNSEEKER